MMNDSAKMNAMRTPPGANINLWKKQLGSVPESVWENIGRLKRIRMLDLGLNQLECAPDALGELDGLTDFSLSP
jgi:hypothetical protein